MRMRDGCLCDVLCPSTTTVRPYLGQTRGVSWTFLINYYECFLGYLIAIFYNKKMSAFCTRLQ